MCLEIYFIQWKWFQCKIQLQTVDHSVRWSMKNAASCVKRCEMQDTPSTWFSNAYCSLGSFPGLRLSEGLYEIKLIVKVCHRVYRYILMLYSRQTYVSSDQTHDRRFNVDACYRPIHWRQRQNTTSFAGHCLIRAMPIRHAFDQSCCVVSTMTLE